MADKSKTIGENPLDAVVPVVEEPTVTAQKQAEPPKPQKERLTIHLPLDLIERVKNAVYWTPGLTLASLGEKALAKVVDQMEKKQGKPFALRRAELKGGRPLK